MIFTGKNLALVRRGISRAISDVMMDIGQYPDVIQHADDIDFLEQEIAEFEKLLQRIDKAIEKEAR